MLLAVVIRWAGLSAFAVLLGAFVLDFFILPRDPALGPARRRLGRWSDAAIGALLVASAGELFLRASIMAGGGPSSAAVAIPAVLAHTHFGAVWIVRAVALSLIPIARRLPTTGAPLPLALVVAGTTALAGHAGDWGDRSPTALADWIHVLAGAAWAGGLLALAPLLSAEARRWPPGTLSSVCRRFSRLAAWCLAAVVGTGAWNAWVQLPDLSALWSSGYGRIFLAKLALVATLVAYGAMNRFFVLPQLAGEAPSLVARLRRYVTREAVLALGVFAVTALLTESTPPRHAGHTEHLQEDAADPDTPGRPITMEALHASGGVPPGWRFTPPAGDAARGREVFARLGCFACHRVAGERFPAATGPGPELTGMGHHHPPGYLLESVLNPNAVVVEGRGYTDARGRSIMPELARGLTVAELLDLVAYLQTL